MANFPSDKIEALQKHWEKFRCEHESEKELRKRTVAGGGIQFVYQCLRCGSATSNAIARAKAVQLNGGTEPPPFDDELISNWKKRASDGAQKITGHFETVGEMQRDEFNKWYSEYLDSPEWERKRHKVLDRARHWCEGCMEAPAKVIHHLTYRNVGDELLFQLVALCDECHSKCHEADEETDT